MELLRKYIRQRRGTIAAAALFCAIFIAVFALYRLPIGAALYPSLLCAMLGTICVIVDLTRASRKHKLLKRLAQLPPSLTDDLPIEDSIDDEDYQAIIRALWDEKANVETAAASEYRDMIDYYTIWAHQIKTPIAAMRLNLQNIGGGESRKLLGDLTRIEQYVEMVLTFLRLGSDTTDYVFKTHSLDKIIRGAVKKFSPEFIGRRISLQYEPVSLQLVTDDKWLSFVLEQIISNALKYTREGSVRIYLSAPETLRVEDTGIGIAPEDLPRVFEKGYTGCNGRADKKASGIGLYLCGRVCDNLGIGISLSSQLGKGTAVTLDLKQYRLRTE